MLEIRERDFETFFDVPFAIYGRDAHYVSPLRSDLEKALSVRNPLFGSEADFTFFTALRNGQPVGRVTAHHHRASNARFGAKQASFGFFDCADDQEAAGALLGRAETWARAQGHSEICGNFNLTAMQQMGIQTDGFARAGYTDMVQAPAYLSGLLEESGYSRFFPMSTYEVHLAQAHVPEDRSGGSLSFAPIARRTFAERMENARVLLNDGFADNPFFVPLTPEEFLFQAGELSTIMDPRLSSVALKDGEPAGVLICIPDLNGFLRATRSRLRWTTPFHYLVHRLTRRRAVIIFYSVARKHHGQGVMSAMLARTLKTARDAGYTELGVTWIADENAASLRMMEKIGARPLHRLHLFRKAVV